MTDPTGASFLSYRRSRAEEARLLIAAQRDHGIPTWQDVSNLDEGPTEEELRRVLQDPSTANAVLWITEDVRDSPVIRKIEAPIVQARARAGDAFFAIPCAAGGLDYDQAAEAVAGATLDDLQNWNIREVPNSPIVAADAALVAKRVLERRVQAVHTHEPAGPLRVQFYTRRAPPRERGIALRIDWSSRFNDRTAPLKMWSDVLLPALASVVNTVREHAPGRVLGIEGLPSLPAAMALGRAFAYRCGVEVAWKQNDEMWGLGASRADSGFVVEDRPGDVTSEHLFVLVAVNADPEHAVARSPGLPRPRATVFVRKPGESTHFVESPQQAVDIAHLVTEATRQATEKYPELRRIHVFAAVPAGLAMLMGQLQNTLGPVQTYEHIQEDAVGTYRKAALLSSC